MEYKLPPLPEFEKWLRTVCFQAPTAEAYDLAFSAWVAAIEAQYRHIGATGWVLREVYFDEDGDALMHREPAPQQELVVLGDGDGPAPLWIQTPPAPQAKPQP